MFQRVYKFFIQGKSNHVYQNITINKESTCDHKTDVVSDEAVDKYSKVNDVNTSNCESVKAQLQDSVDSSTMVDVASCSLEITGDEGQNVTSNNIDCVLGAAVQDIGVWPSEVSQSFRDIMVTRGTCQLQNKDIHFPEDENGRSLNKYVFDKTLQNGEKINRT